METAQTPPAAATTSLLDIVRDAAGTLQSASGADIVAIYLFDAATRQYYAPVALGIPESDLTGSLADMQDQLARYDADRSEGKAPPQVRPADYGPNVWLTVSQQPLVVTHAQAELSTSFVRRLKIRAVVGLPLLSGSSLLGIVYLDYLQKPEGEQPEVPPAATGEALTRLQEQVAAAGRRIEQARDAEERAAFVASGHLATHLTAAALGGGTARGSLHRELGDALSHLLDVTRFDAALIYQTSAPGRLELAAQQGLPDAPTRITRGQAEGGDAWPADWDPQNDAQLGRAIRAGGFTAAVSLPLQIATQPPARSSPGAPPTIVGSLVMLSRDRLASQRATPATHLLLQSAAELVAGALAGEKLFLTLEHANRVFGALSRLSGAILQPGATRQQVLDAVVRHLIDPDIPEFAFQFATVFLLADPQPADSTMALRVQMAAGATADGRVAAVPPNTPTTSGTGPIRVPGWVQIPDRALAPDDILAYVARQRHIVIVGPVAEGGSDRGEPEGLVNGYPSEQLARREIQAIRADGTSVAVAPAVLVGGQHAGVEQHVATAADRPFTLAADIFEAYRHGDLLRVFIPFGLSVADRASGVLEVGYHRSQRRTIERTQVESLRATAAQIAVGVETARLYEETRLHAEQLEIIADVSKAMASSLDLDQTLHIVARCLERSVSASFCQIALYEEDGSAWYGAAATDDEALWRRQRGERGEGSFFFDLLETRSPMVIPEVQGHAAVNSYYARLFGIRSLVALPLIARGHPIGVAVLAQRDGRPAFGAEEVQRVEGLSHQAAIAIQNARMYASAEEDPHIQRDVVLVGFGEWGHKAYEHLLTLKQFFNFKIHVVERDIPGRRQALESAVREVVKHGDAIYWDSAELSARAQLRRVLEASCYVIAYIATPAPTHLAVLAQYYDLSNVIVIEKPLGAPAEAYREFLDSVEAGVQIVAADHYYFKLEVRLLHLLLTEERTLKSFLDDVEEIEIELVEERPLGGAAADIGIIEDMLPHAFAIVSLFTPIDRLQFDAHSPVTIARQEPLEGPRETYARICATFPHRNRTVRLTVDVGKGVEDAKWIKLIGERRLGGRPAFYKFDFAAGQAIDGTQTNLHAATRAIRQPGVPDNAHLTMLRHVIEKRYPAVGILAIREAMRSNQRISELADLATELLSKGQWTTYRQGQRPQLPGQKLTRLPGDAGKAGTADRRVG